MKHYLTAEWGRAVARPYFRAFLLVLLALAAGLPLLWRFGLGDKMCIRDSIQVGALAQAAGKKHLLFLPVSYTHLERDGDFLFFEALCINSAAPWENHSDRVT